MDILFGLIYIYIWSKSEDKDLVHDLANEMFIKYYPTFGGWQSMERMLKEIDERIADA